MSNDSKKISLKVKPLFTSDEAASAPNLDSPLVTQPSDKAELVFTPKHKLARSPVRQGPFASTPRPNLAPTDDFPFNSVGGNTIITRARQRALSLEEGRKKLEFEQGIEDSLLKLRELRTHNPQAKSQELITLDYKTIGNPQPLSKPFSSQSDLTGEPPSVIEDDKTLTQGQFLISANVQPTEVDRNANATEESNSSTQGVTFATLPNDSGVQSVEIPTVHNLPNRPPKPLSPKVIINTPTSGSNRSEVSSPSSEEDYQVRGKPVTEPSGSSVPITAFQKSPKMDTTIADAKTATLRPAVPTFLSPQTYHPSRGLASSFIGNYERSSIANGWDNTLKIAYFGSFLEGAANLWYKLYTENPNNKQKTWDNIKDDFLSEFGDPDISKTIKSRLESRKQLPNEKVKDFFYELSILYYEFDQTMNEEQFIEYFEKGLTEQCGYHYYWLTHPPNDKPRSLDEIKELASTIDKAPTIVGMVPAAPPVATGPPQRNVYPQNFYRGNGYRHPQTPSYRPPNGKMQSYNQVPRQTYDVAAGATAAVNGRGQYNLRGNGRNYTQPRQKPPNFYQFNQRSRTSDNRPKCFACNGLGHYASACPNYRGRQN